MSKIEAVYDIVAAKDRPHLFDEGQPNEPHNWIDQSGGGTDMFTG